MIQIIPSESRYKADHGWLVSRFSFSFADYHDPSNRTFGALRVLNDDIIQPGTGFGMHPHADMEIVTYVIEGTLEHRDSMGNRGLIEAGEVQRMTAGTGIYHSEENPSADKPLRLLQLWVLPKHKDLEPSWEQKHFALEQQKNRLLPVISETPLEEALQIHQDATFYLSTFDPGHTLVHTQKPMRRMHLFVIGGSLRLNGEHTLANGDAARVSNETEIALEALEPDTRLMLIDLA